MVTTKSFLDMTEEERANLPEMQYLDLINGPPPFTSYYDIDRKVPVVEYPDGRRFVTILVDGQLRDGDELPPAPGSEAERLRAEGQKVLLAR